MCNWRRWVLPGLLLTPILTALATVFHAGPIERDLQAKASQALEATHGWAAAEFDGRDVTLSGLAPSTETQQQAAAIVQDIFGVRIVRDATMLIELADPFVIRLSKGTDGVMFSGYVPTEESRRTLLAIAQTTMPGFAITDELTLARGTPDGFEDLAVFAARQLAHLAEGNVSLEGAAYSVSGVAAASEAYEALREAAFGVLPGVASLGQFAVRPPAADGVYGWTARKDADGRMTLRGLVPSLEVRDALIAAAGAEEGTAVTNEMLIASGAADGFGEVAAFGLTQLTGLTTGVVTIRDQSYSIRALAPDEAAAEVAQAAAGGGLPGDVSAGTIAITTAPTPDGYGLEVTKADDGTIILSGFVPSAEVASQLHDRLSQSDPAAGVTDHMLVAGGAPNGFEEAARFSIAYLPYMSEGTVSVTGTGVTVAVSGLAIDGDRLEAARQLQADAPQNVLLETSLSLAAADEIFELVATRTDDVLILSGFAPDNASKTQILEAARTVDGVTVVDRVELAGGAPDGVNWAEAGGFLVTGLAGVTNGTAALRGTELSIDAESSDMENLAVARAAWELPLPEGTVLGDRLISLPQVSPYVWTAELDDGLRLTGYVPSSDAADTLVAEARLVLGADASIENELKLASGAPEGFEDAATSAISALGRLQSGSASMTDGAIEVSGFAFSATALTAVETALNESLPAEIVSSFGIDLLPGPLEPGGLGALEPAACQSRMNTLLAEGQVLFDTGEAGIDRTSFGLLDRLAYTVRSCPDVTVRVDGHTDADGPDGFNLDLSQRRAQSVVDYLTSVGVSPERVEARGFGESQPIAANNTPEGKAANRRIEFNIIE